MKKFAALALALSLLLLSACGNEEVKEESSSPSEASSQQEASQDEKEDVKEEEQVNLPPKKVEPTEKWAEGFLPQVQVPSEDAPYAILHTNMGDIKMVLFPEAAPLTVENFIVHSQEGYYDGLTFHRVINDFMIQGGDPNGDGTGGESIWKANFRDEVNPHLHNFRGAVSMANAGPYTNGSQFFIVQARNAGKLDEPERAGMEAQMFFNKLTTEVYEKANDLLYENPPKTEEEGKAFQEAVQKMENEANELLKKGVPDDFDMSSAFDQYEKYGGTPHLDFKHTVFGQVVEGMDVVDKIAAVKTVENDAPEEDVIIETVEIINPPVYE